eukprot:s2091_g6.t1
MLKYACLICFTNLLNVEGERPTYADLSNDGTIPIFRGASSFSESGKATGRTFPGYGGGSSFLTKDVEFCHAEKEIMAEVFQDLGFRNLQGSYCQWPQVVCQECHVTELRVDLKQAQDSQDVPVRLSPALGRLRRLQLLDLGGSSKLSGDLAVLHNATELQTVNLSHSQVEGNLDVFQHHPKLKVLDLEGTKVEGSIEVFKSTPFLKILNMAGTIGKISGDINVFEHTKDLEILRLTATEVEADRDFCARMCELSLENTLEVTGSLGVFTTSKNLQELRIEHAPRISGDLSRCKLPSLRKLILKGMALEGFIHELEKGFHFSPEETFAPLGLVEMRLESSSLEGDIRFLRHFPNLQVLSLKENKITGDLSELQHLKLRQLNLLGSQVNGSIDALQLNQMEVLKLRATNVSGDIAVFQHAERLRNLDISETHVQGNIAVFRDAGSLRDLDLSGSLVYGNISSFRNSSHLRRLHIYETALFGDIHSFQGTSQLQELLAWSTMVTGDIQVFANAHKLRKISLGYTSVHGNLTVFTNIQRLELVGFSDSKVSGDIAAFGQATQLVYFWLQATATFGDISVLGNNKKLKEVTLGLTNVSGNVEVFSAARETVEMIYLESTRVEGSIKVFQDATRLKTLNLANTQISGDLEVLSDVTSLRHLRLDRCNVAGNISAISTENLEVLSLSGTRVGGSLRFLGPKLRELRLAATAMEGDLSDLTSLPEIETVDLSSTHVGGQITAEWDGHCKRLRYLDLSESRAVFVPEEPVVEDIVVNRSLEILPALARLKVKGLHLNAAVKSLFQLLRASPLSTLVASSCGLTGNLIDLSLIRSSRAKNVRHLEDSPLATSLLDLDLSNNSLQRVEALPLNARTQISFNDGDLSFSKGVLAKAFMSGYELDLRSTRLADFSEPLELFRDGKLKLTPGFVWTNEEKGYGCYSFAPGSTNVQIVSGDYFLPDKMCVCLKGWSGAGTKCDKCRNGTYSADRNASSCTWCPPESYTETLGATSPSECRCTIGKSIKNGTACGCGESFALHDGVCVNCLELNLDCSTEGLIAITAPPHDGFARLEARARRGYKCFQPSKERCNRSGGAEEICAPGYAGYLCMDCRPKYFASGGRCWRCDTSRDASNRRLRAAAGVGTGALLAMAGAWMFYPWVAAGAQRFSGMPFVVDLKQKAPLLLQSSQLWAVLSALSISEQGRQRGEHMRSFTNFEVKMPELPYIRGLRFSLIDLQGTFNFQCVVEGATARYWVALLAPIVPLLFLLACGVLESSNHGSGISKVLLILSIFFVGGASSCAKLISCKLYDAGGDSLGDFAFQELMPSRKCSDLAPEVKAVFLVTSLCYAILVPCFLLYLFARQHFALRSNKLLVSCSKPKMVEEKELHFEQIPRKADSQLPEMKEEMLERRLVAAAVAYSAVFLDGEVQVALKDSTVTVEGQDAHRTSDIFYLHTLESFWLDVVEAKEHGSALRCHAITEMLMERCVLFERCELAAPEERERVLGGARDMLIKYAVCQNVWMEILLKLVTISLVSVVQNPHDGLKMSLAVTLVMATLVALFRPYAQAQVNNLQCSCFISLSIAAISFSLQMPWLSRVSLVLPFLVALAQVGLPESPEGRASRIWQELEPQLQRLPGGAIRASSKTLKVAVHRKG